MAPLLRGGKVAVSQLASRRPGAGRYFGNSTGREVGQAREYRARIVANPDLKSPTSFNDRDDGRYAWTSFFATDVDPIPASKSNWTYRILRPVIG